ncbi:related to heterokaryon incompatibility protein het-6 [Phialocephala subalpina]|uniref:Related to heterokaryon incompatibility protein het-6 n=1 Tax=Phialocephala subalpina TaxID=576137 RepID=A0A1L7X4F6_9HELO|nr:related to heterokaryon incompatibility protein het-6 [Phialocephala subalpina]
MEESQYQYQPLQNNDSIRILTLDPGQQSDPLMGTLETIRIDSTGRFEALSYVWADPGPPDSAYEILIRNGDEKGGLLMLRGGSIFAAMCRVRLPDRPRRIWADQCCINQDDPVERSQQLPFMNRIYRDAACVLVWLGLDTKKEAELAFGLIHELNEALGSQPVDGISPDLDTVDLEKHVMVNQKALQALTDRPWFKRGWIVQEIGTGTPATMLWGDAAIDWITLASVCERLKSYHHLRSALGITTSDISFLFRRFIEPDENTHHANRFNFIYELQRARHLRFSDDRDRIFAFLGHFSALSRHPPGCGPVSIVADYTKTVEQTYTNIAVQILRTNPAAACILLASVQHARHSLPSCYGTGVQADSNLETWLVDGHRLPSWVPDWRWSEAIILAEPISPHLAHGSSTAKLKIVREDTLVLRAHGVEVDSIEECSQPLLSRDFYNQKTSKNPSTTIQRLWHEICRKKAFNLNEKYLDGQGVFFAYMQTLSNGCVQAAGHGGRSYQDISDLVWLRKAARYIVEASDDVSEEIKSAARSGEPEGDHETWSRWAASASEGRVFARTWKGYFVLGPKALEAGDVICVLFGARVPFCLRPIGKRYLLVGECYVHGLMNGEAISLLLRDELHEKIFDIV